MIEINNLSFSYKKNRPIFDKVSLTMQSGIYGLLGENGVGKTTLLHIICGLRFPKEGTCKVFGYESAYRNPRMLSDLFFLPEEFETIPMSIENYAKYNSVFYPNFSDEEFSKYLSEFHVDKTQKMSEQSLGQKKKAMIAFALSLNTPILLLDEPTNGLDIPSKSQFRKVLSSIYSEDRCIIISSHQVRDIENLIDPIIILDYNDVLINQSIEDITKKLRFSYSLEKPDNALYIEQGVQGYTAVSINTDDDESVINIEVLFNTVINNKDQIKKLFKA